MGYLIAYFVIGLIIAIVGIFFTSYLDNSEKLKFHGDVFTLNLIVWPLMLSIATCYCFYEYMKTFLSKYNNPFYKEPK